MTEGQLLSRPNRPPALRERLLRVLLLSTCFATVMLVLYAHLIVWPQQFRAGQVAPYTIFAPVAFIFEDRQLLERMTGSSEGNAVHLAVDLRRREETLARFDEFAAELKALRQAWIHGGAANAEAEARTEQLASDFAVDLLAVKSLLRRDEGAERQALETARGKLDSEMGGVVNQTLIQQLRQRGAAEVVEQPESIYKYFLIANLVEYKPPDLSEEARRTAQSTVMKGSVVVAEGQVVNARIADQLQALKPHLLEHQFLRLAGLGLIFLAALLIWRQYAVRFAPRLLGRPVITVQLSVLLVLFLMVGLLIGRLPFNYFYYGVSFAVATAATVVVMVYDAQFATYFALGLGLMLCMALSYSADLTLYTLASALLPTALVSAESHRRGQVLFAIALGLFNVVLAAVVILVSVQTLHWEVFVIAFAAGLGAGIVALGLLPVLETLTSQLTPGKLTEFANPENALLKRLKREAHGTYAHSVLVADLAEEACRAIGARALLAKVGALYHDIGKLKRPGFFAENIHDLHKNPHQGLPPDTSVKILREHVIDGLHMAEEQHLPRELLPFIGEHHGSYLIRYFYYHALRLHERDPQRYAVPVRDDYCYHGLTPQSRETGVMMLADITEAMLRARRDAKQDEVREIIAGIVAEKIEEGQLIDSGLTLGELERVKTAFFDVMTAQRHVRMSYPGIPAAPVHFHFMGRDIPETVLDASESLRAET
jgi:hypothetical protein